MQSNLFGMHKNVVRNLQFQRKTWYGTYNFTELYGKGPTTSTTSTIFTRFQYDSIKNTSEMRMCASVHMWVQK